MSTITPHPNQPPRETGGQYAARIWIGWISEFAGQSVAGKCPTEHQLAIFGDHVASGVDALPWIKTADQLQQDYKNIHPWSGVILAAAERAGISESQIPSNTRRPLLALPTVDVYEASRVAYASNYSRGEWSVPTALGRVRAGGGELVAHTYARWLREGIGLPVDRQRPDERQLAIFQAEVAREVELLPWVESLTQDKPLYRNVHSRSRVIVAAAEKAGIPENQIPSHIRRPLQSLPAVHVLRRPSLAYCSNQQDGDWNSPTLAGVIAPVADWTSPDAPVSRSLELQNAAGSIPFNLEF